MIAARPKSLWQFEWSKPPRVRFTMSTEKDRYSGNWKLVLTIICLVKVMWHFFTNQNVTILAGQKFMPFYEFWILWNDISSQLVLKLSCEYERFERKRIKSLDLLQSAKRQLLPQSQKRNLIQMKEVQSEKGESCETKVQEREGKKKIEETKR